MSFSTERSRPMMTQVLYNVQLDPDMTRDGLEHLLGEFDLEAFGLRRNGHGFLSNGGRFFITGAPEAPLLGYSTPESLGAKEAAKSEHAVHPLVEAIARSGLPTSNPAAGAYKRTGHDHDILHPTTTTYTELYHTPISSELLIGTPLLESFIATRGIWAGAGMVGRRFRLTQKADGVSSGLEPGKVPMVRRPTSTIDPWLQVHGGDANMSPWVTTLKLATTSLALRMIEQGRAPAHLRFASPRAVLKKVSYAANFHTSYRTVSGQTMTAANHVEAWGLAGLKMVDEVEVPEDERQGAELLARLGSSLNWVDVAARKLGDMPTKLDWAAKLSLIWQKTGGPVDRDNPQAVKTDLLWERLGVPGYGQQHWQQHPLRGFEPQTLAGRLLVAPETRASVRQRLIDLGHPGITPTSLSVLSDTTQGYERELLLGNPYSTEIPLSVRQALAHATGDSSWLR